MGWEHFEVTHSGPVAVQNAGGGEVVQGWCEIATVSTGKNRAFYGYAARVIVDGHAFEGGSRHAALKAVLACGARMQEDQLVLLVAGASDRFRESGLSSGSGYGYVGRGKAVHHLGQGYVASGGPIPDEPWENSLDLPTCYFAYGSNMCRQQMAVRCPGAVLHGTAVLTGFEYRINRWGVATLVPNPCKEVHGVLWLLNSWHERVLDSYEGVPVHYRRLFVDLHASGRRAETLLYLATDSTAGVPREGYQENIVASAKSLDIPAEYVRELVGWLS